ncbi:MAG: ATP-binding cassette domain-containing protein [Lentisphaerae bacterium]|nr:ATP-binding cassette domain-containing protein [Lentisphaerota bacterium]
MIQVEHLTRRFGRTTAVDNVSFRVARGEILGFLGPNGAGKTTTLRILACALAPTGGRVYVNGLDVFTQSLAVRRRVGYLPENLALYPDMRVGEYLRYRGRLKGLGRRALRIRVADAVTRCGLAGAERQMIGRLSRGYRQRVGLADALLHDPAVLLLDEPTIGLDPYQIRETRRLIAGLGGRHTVILSSHLLPEVETVCQRVLIMNRGAIVACDTPETLAARMKARAELRAEIRGPREAVTDVLRRVPGVAHVSGTGDGEWGQYACLCEDAEDLREAVFRAVAGQGWTLRELRTVRRNLEDVFMALTETDAPEARAETWRF